jgi:YidC/Oxa1 family membrane protein insertase
MDNRRTYIGVALIVILSMGYWSFLQFYFKPHHPELDWENKLEQPGVSTTAHSSTQPALYTSGQQGIGPMPGATTGVATTGAATTTSPAAFRLLAATQPGGGDTQIGSTVFKDPNLTLAVSLSPQGAAIDSVTVNSYNNADRKGLYTFQQPFGDSPDSRSLATLNITIDSQPSIDLGNANWILRSQSPTSATYSITLLDAHSLPLFRITKTFTLHDRGPEANRDNTAAGYEADVTYDLQNLSAQSHTASLAFAGPTMPERETERSDDRQMVAGYDKGANAVEVTRDYLASFTTKAPQKDMTSAKGYKFLWAGESSVYFSAIILPQKPEQIQHVEADCLNPDALADDRMVTLQFQTLATPIAAGSTLDIPLKVFLGPKVRNLFEGDYYGEYPRAFNQLLSGSSSMCGICALPWLVDRLVDLLRLFHAILFDWGLAIIALVIVVRAILHPISKSSQVSMLKMQKMGPELERLKKKFGDDKEGFSKAQMELTKEMGIMPFLGCLPMFLQMPIWIALYSALQNEIALRQAPFLWGFTWIHDLARPDRLISWDAHPFIVPFFGVKLVSLNILPFFVATVMFIQQKMQPQPPTLTDEQKQQQKMMRFMSLAFSVFFYWMPSGLNLYILTSSTIAIFESKRIREHIKQVEEREKQNKVIIDAKATRQGKQLHKAESSKDTESKAGCLTSFWTNLQNKVEAVRQEAEKKAKRG